MVSTIPDQLIDADLVRDVQFSLGACQIYHEAGQYGGFYLQDTRRLQNDRTTISLALIPREVSAHSLDLFGKDIVDNAIPGALLLRVDTDDMPDYSDNFFTGWQPAQTRLPHQSLDGLLTNPTYENGILSPNIEGIHLPYRVVDLETLPEDVTQYVNYPTPEGEDWLRITKGKDVLDIRPAEQPEIGAYMHLHEEAIHSERSPFTALMQYYNDLISHNREFNPDEEFAELPEFGTLRNPYQSLLAMMVNEFISTDGSKGLKEMTARVLLQMIGLAPTSGMSALEDSRLSHVQRYRLDGLAETNPRLDTAGNLIEDTIRISQQEAEVIDSYLYELSNAFRSEMNFPEENYVYNNPLSVLSAQVTEEINGGEGVLAIPNWVANLVSYLSFVYTQEGEESLRNAIGSLELINKKLPKFSSGISRTGGNLFYAIRNAVKFSEQDD